MDAHRRRDNSGFWSCYWFFLPTGEHLADVAWRQDCRRVGRCLGPGRGPSTPTFTAANVSPSQEPLIRLAYKVMMPRLTPDDRRVRAIIKRPAWTDILYAAFGRFLRNVQAAAIFLMA